MRELKASAAHLAWNEENKEWILLVYSGAECLAVRMSRDALARLADEIGRKADRRGEVKRLPAKTAMRWFERFADRKFAIFPDGCLVADPGGAMIDYYASPELYELCEKKKYPNVALEDYCE